MSALRDLRSLRDLRDARDPRETGERCAVCGCTDIRIDEVHHRGAWRLAECPRCDHRAMHPLVHRARPLSVDPALPIAAAADAA